MAKKRVGRPRKKPADKTVEPTPPAVVPPEDEIIVRTFVSDEGVPALKIVEPQGEEDIKPISPPKSPPLPKWRVALSCPTPIAHTELVVEAATEIEAREKFMLANGICGSQGTWTVKQLTAAEEEDLEKGVSDAVENG